MKNFLTVLASIALLSPAYAGPGHDHGESAFAEGGAPVTHFNLNEAQIQNLDIRSEPVQRLPIQDTVDMLAFTELLPEKHATISPRFGGKILDIAVKVGQKVVKNQRLATLEPVSVGNSSVVLKAPMSGFVVSLPAGVGKIIEPGGTIMEIGDPSQMLLRGVLYETPDITKIDIGQSAHAHLDIEPERELIGKVQRINRAIDPQSRTFSIYALIETPEGDISPGLQGRLEIATGKNDPVLAVSKRAVLGEMGTFFVYVINGLEVERRDVTLGAKSGQHIEIKDGVEVGEQVVTQGNYQLQYISVGGVNTHDHGPGEGHHDHEDEHGHGDDQHNHEHEAGHEDHEDHADHNHANDESHDHHEEHQHEKGDDTHKHDEGHEHKHDHEHDHHDHHNDGAE
ncbi:MAG: efflux RND transporter periplasmic adaptor subunit [Hyphomicrobiales bacterium]